MNVNDQLSMLRLLCGEPEDPNVARFSPAQLIIFLNEGRRWLSEYTRCFQIKDSQTTNPGGVYTKFYSVPTDVIGFCSVEWDGIPLDPIDPRDWRSRVGDDDDIAGTPFVFKYFAKQIQLFYVPEKQALLRYEGWGYCNDLQVGGADPDLTDQQARGAIYWAAVLAKGSDKREETFEYKTALGIGEELRKQYRPKGPRYVRETNSRRSIVGRIFYG